MSWGNSIKLSIFGESHGPAIGAVLEGVPAGLFLSEEEIERDMARRAPGYRLGATARKESDCPKMLGGYYEEHTTGSPLMALIQNSDAHSKDYAALKDKPRPGHADYTARLRYGNYADLRGGGHFSGRLTAPLVWAGAVARQFLANQGVTVGAHLLQIGSARDESFSALTVDEALLRHLYDSPFPVLDATKKEAMEGEIRQAASQLDSVGGVVECAAIGLMPGIGEPGFDGIEPRIASLLYAIPAVKGVEFGGGFALAGMRGSQANDPLVLREGELGFSTNWAGGALGGITTGAPLIVKVAFKPTPSIAQKQKTVDLARMEETEIAITGRHDACIAVRGVPVVEAAVLVALMDLYLTQGVGR